MPEYMQMMIDTSAQETDAEYQAFVDKFKPRKTTDDCYTPPLVYDAVRDWACAEYGIDPEAIVRPFYPGGDYEHYDYPKGCVVLDNPPFSILSKICAFYLDKGIQFFLFAPSLTVLSGRSTVMRMNHIICDADITYENGAVVRTAFVTSYGEGEIMRTAPMLKRAIDAATQETLKAKRKQRPKYEYPDYVVTAAAMQKLAKYGIDFAIGRNECCSVSQLDSMRERGKAIFGGGLLLNEEAAARRAAAERAAAEVWNLSEHEWKIVRRMSERGSGRAE